MTIKSMPDDHHLSRKFVVPLLPYSTNGPGWHSEERSPRVAERSSCRSRSSHGPCALPDHGVEGIGEHSLRAAVEAAHVLEVAGLPQVLLYEVHVALVV